MHLRKWRNRPTFTYQQKEVSQHPIFWQYFVPGADAYLSHNNNTSLGLANGTRIKLHSLSFSSQIAQAIVKQKQELSPPGSIITLSDDLIPSSVNFTLDVESQPSDHKIEFCNLLQQFSIVPNETVLPLLQNEGTQNSIKWYTAPSKYPAYASSRIETSVPFAFDLVFAITNHKAQGQTLHKVILCLSERPSYLRNLINFSAMYVAFSRVKKSEDIRLLVHNDRHKELSYLKSLRPDPTIVAFYDGFLPNQSWGARLAADSYMQLLKP